MGLEVRLVGVVVVGLLGLVVGLMVGLVVGYQSDGSIGGGGSW